MYRKTIKTFKTILINFLVLLLLFSILEVIWLLQGYQPAVFETVFVPTTSPEFEPIFQADSIGITSYHQNGSRLRIPSDQYFGLNPQGFFSPYDFIKDTSALEDEVKVMLIGDSYTEGCCAEPKAFSFAQSLDREPNVKAYNLGIGGTDPVQYRLVLEKYLPIIKPDQVLVFIYAGNDLLTHAKKPRPHIPQNIAIRGQGLLKSEVIHGDSVYQFHIPEEAYNWHIQNLTLLGENRSIWKRIIRKSAVLSQLYFHLSIAPKINQNDPVLNRLPYTNMELKRMNEFAKQNGTDMLFLLIPSVNDVMDQVNLWEKYGFAFEGLSWSYPDIKKFWVGDYDGLTIDAHFNNVGHLKYYFFLHDLLYPTRQQFLP